MSAERSAGVAASKVARAAAASPPWAATRRHRSSQRARHGASRYRDAASRRGRRGAACAIREERVPGSAMPSSRSGPISCSRSRNRARRVRPALSVRSGRWQAAQPSAAKAASPDASAGGNGAGRLVDIGVEGGDDRLGDLRLAVFRAGRAPRQAVSAGVQSPKGSGRRAVDMPMSAEKAAATWSAMVGEDAFQPKRPRRPSAGDAPARRRCPHWRGWHRRRGAASAPSPAERQEAGAGRSASPDRAARAARPASVTVGRPPLSAMLGAASGAMPATPKGWICWP